MKRTRIIILGAGGRDFHNFNMLFRNNASYKVVAFTATQIPEIVERTYPKSLAGELYPKGIPIYPMDRLEEIVASHKVDECYFSYSDASYVEVMQVAARVLSAGARFILLPPYLTMLKSKKPVIAVVAVRTGCGKSQTARFIARSLREMGMRVAVLRHPMPYGNLEAQRVQMFQKLEDLSKARCTIEEREEYEHHLRAGNVVFAGVLYKDIIKKAEKHSDVILWDGGNNDTPFIRPSVMITVTDPHRAGHERLYYPGEINLKLADIVIVNKVDTARKDQIRVIEENVRQVNPRAHIIYVRSPITVDDPSLIKGKRVLVIDDGPTLTHGEMSFGAAYIAAEKFGAKEIVPAEPYVVGTIKSAYEKYPHIKKVLPALGYSERQLKELEKSIARVPCDTVIIGTPIDLSSIITIPQRTVRARYALEETKPGEIMKSITQLLRI